MRTSDLTGAALDWAVAKCEGHTGLWIEDDLHGNHISRPYTPSTDWSQGGPIIERERIAWTGQSARICRYFGKHTWQNFEEFGPTPLIAAMRCYVACKLGAEIEIPEELK